MAKRLSRAEVPEELTWNLTDLFPDDSAWEQEFSLVIAEVQKVSQFKGRFAQGPSVLLDCFEFVENLVKQVFRVVSYASLKMSADGTSPSNQAMASRAGALIAQVGAHLSFVQTELLELPEETVRRYFEEEPRLRDFQRMVDKILRLKPHILHPETEKVLAALGEILDAPSTVYQISKAADITFEPVTDKNGNNLAMSFALYENKYEISPDTALRRNSYASFTEGLKHYQNTYGATLGTEFRKNVVLANLRRYPSAIHMFLHQQEVPIEVYNNLHDTILTELAPHMRRYAHLRKEVLGLDEILYCDLEAPLDPDFNPQTTFEEASDIISKGLSILGPEYIEIINSGLKNRWIDLADNIGKSTGAFCNTVPGAHPYILTTWTDNMRDALTLAHELGHAGNGELTFRYQRLANASTPMFFVEAPSTINELLVADYMMSQTTDARMRRWIIMQLLSTYHHNFVRHLIEGELQRRVYTLAEQGQPITASILSKIQGDILKDFWGDELVIDDGARLTWMRQPHYYMGLYPYTYSAGLTIGTAVARAIRQEGKPAIDRWLEALKAGGSKDPIGLAEMAGIDMTKPDPIRTAVEYVGSLIDEVVESFKG
jgi:oligoendopeptidase F